MPIDFEDAERIGKIQPFYKLLTNNILKIQPFVLKRLINVYLAIVCSCLVISVRDSTTWMHCICVGHCWVNLHSGWIWSLTVVSSTCNKPNLSQSFFHSKMGSRELDFVSRKSGKTFQAETAKRESRRAYADNAALSSLCHQLGWNLKEEEDSKKKLTALVLWMEALHFLSVSALKIDGDNHFGLIWHSRCVRCRSDRVLPTSLPPPPTAADPPGWRREGRPTPPRSPWSGEREDDRERQRDW